MFSTEITKMHTISTPGSCACFVSGISAPLLELVSTVDVFPFFRTAFFIALVFLSPACCAVAQTVELISAYGPSGHSISDIEVTQSGDVFVAARTGVYVRRDGEMSWDLVGGEELLGMVDAFTSLYEAVDGHLYLGTREGAFVSTDDGATWDAIDFQLGYDWGGDVVGFAMDSAGYLYVAREYGVAMKGAPFGGEAQNSTLVSDWTLVFDDPVDTIAADANGRIFIGSGGSAYRRTDHGSGWGLIAHNEFGGVSGPTYSWAFGTDGKIFVGAKSGLFVSTDDGQTWSRTDPFHDQTNTVRAIIARPDGMMIAATSYYLYRSTDSGESWEVADSSRIRNDLFRVRTLAIAADGTFLAGNEQSGMMQSSLDGASWEYINSGLSNIYVEALFEDGDGRVVVGENGQGGGSHVYATSDNGRRWEHVGFPGTWAYHLMSVAAKEDTVLAGSESNLLLSPDFGRTWQYPSTSGEAESVSLQYIRRLLPREDEWYAAMDFTIARSEDGLFWQRDSSRTILSGVFDLFLSPQETFFAATDHGVYRSEGPSIDWTLMSYPFESLNALEASTVGTLIAGTEAGIYSSSDDGLTWALLYTTPHPVASLALNSQDAIFAGGEGLGLVWSPDGGTSWIDIGTDIESKGVGPILVNDDDLLFVGTHGSGVFRSAQPTVVHVETDPSMPSKVLLSSVYPNPSARETTVSVSIPVPGTLEIELFDARGSKIRDLVSKRVPSGVHRFEWDAQGMASGLYFCRVRFGDRLETHKLLLMR